MKKNDWILVTSVCLYSFLFYKQSAGINFLLFNTALIFCLWLKDNCTIKNIKWNFAAIGCIISSACITYYGNGLSVMANIISLSILSAISCNKQGSVILSILFTFYSFATSIIFMFLDWQARQMKRFAGSTNSTFKRILLIIIPVLISFIFFLIYRESNPLFYDLTKNFSMDFISIDLIFFTIGGILLLYGFFYHRKIKLLAELEENKSNDLDPANNKTLKLFQKEISISEEEFSGTILFALLNLLLLIVNGLDFSFLFLDRKLPEGISYSEFVHQGTGMLILSVFLAITIILFFFRGAINFSKTNKAIKILAYLWILQNTFMLFSTVLRNNMYITEYGLTYKRIGVYFYLGLTSIGLITTFIKIIKAKSNIFLFRINGWLFYAVLVLSCTTNWDMLITNYNITTAKKLEKNYLLNLSDANLPELFVLLQDTSVIQKEFFLNNDEREERNTNFQNMNIIFETRLNKRLYHFLDKYDQYSWKSWNFTDKKTYLDLMTLNKNEKITSLKLSSMGIETMKPIKQFSRIKELDLSSNKFQSLAEIISFKNLRKLNLRNNQIRELQGIEIFSDLEYLDISHNLITDYSKLNSLKNLKELKVDSLTNIQQSILQLNLPYTKIIKS